MMKSVQPASISIEEDIDSNSGMVMSDPTQLHQIIINLCTNAAHAMEDNGGKLQLTLQPNSFDESMSELHPGMPQGDYLHLSICDSGHGIPLDILEIFFDPYFTTKEEEKVADSDWLWCMVLLKPMVHISRFPARKTREPVFMSTHCFQQPRGTADVCLIAKRV